MYLLLFQAWAQLCGFSKIGNAIYWSGALVRVSGSSNNISTWEAMLNTNIALNPDATTNNAEMLRAYGLSNIMTHASMILIFVFIIMFFVFIFRLVSGMLAGRR